MDKKCLKTFGEFHLVLKNYFDAGWKLIKEIAKILTIVAHFQRKKVGVKKKPVELLCC